MLPRSSCLTGISPCFLAFAALIALTTTSVHAQWTHRYPKVDGYSHHVYLEGYELPILTTGPIDAAPSPDGRHIAFASRGWIWIMDEETRVARQLTQGPDVDSRPAWHPSGEQLAMVRDNGSDTRIEIIDVASGTLMRTLDTPAIDLDPAFASGGQLLFYTSGEAGTLDVWSLDLTSGESLQETNVPGIEMKPQPLADGRFMVLSKRGIDRVVVLSEGESTQTIVSERIASMARPVLSPDERTIALNWPTQDGWELRLYNIEYPVAPVTLASGGLPLTPAWSTDGQWLYFSEADENEVMHLYRIRSVGGAVERVAIDTWDWAQGTARLRIRTEVLTGQPGAEPAPARLNVVDATGHPAVPDEGGIHFDGTNGRHFFYSPGEIEITVPAGMVTVAAVQGLATPEVQVTVEAKAGVVTDVTLVLEPVWDAHAAGWTSGDHHFHLNYGGQTDLDPWDMVPKMQGEALDVATPLLANLHNRIEDQDYWGWEKLDEPPFIRFGQEIRSHFLGHVGLIEISDLYWPWMWGPGYEVYGTDDRPNADALDFAHDQGGLGYYVHPVSSADPFADFGADSVPIELIADAVLGDVDALEIICLWSNSYGITALWHQLLNLGIPIAPSAGTDVMLNLHRTMALGTTRVYVRTGEEQSWAAYIMGLKEGHSFVTNGPLMEFTVEGMHPGEVVASGPASWTLELYTATEVDSVDIFVNGEVVASYAGLDSPGHRTYTGTVELPSGGWITAQARGGSTQWPSMDAAPFAHTAPVWIEKRGSTLPDIQRHAAGLLLDLAGAAYRAVRSAYDETPYPRLHALFREAFSWLAPRSHYGE